eukprot:scaffold569_cov408-Prasinococcus_capsulatus_cf.AAC.12
MLGVPVTRRPVIQSPVGQVALVRKRSRNVQNVGGSRGGSAPQSALLYRAVWIGTKPLAESAGRAHFVRAADAGP